MREAAHILADAAVHAKLKWVLLCWAVTTVIGAVGWVRAKYWKDVAWELALKAARREKARIEQKEKERGG